MRPISSAFVVGAAASAVLASAPRVARAQSLLDRPDNISTDWIGNTSTLYFNFVHRFSVSPPPERKVSNFPTFLIATGIASEALVGVDYATNSSLAARYPNEWEFFGRYAGLQQDDGAPFDLGGQLDYNLAVKGTEGEVSIARREGPVRLAAVSRLIADTLNGNNMRFAFGGGGTLRFGRFVAISGDAVTLAKREPGETIAWSAGLHIALPNTPHTLSLHVSNAGTSTLQGLTRGGKTRRYGFEFTIPIHVSRFFTAPEAAPSVVADATPNVAPGDSAAPVKPAPPSPVKPSVAAPVAPTPPAPVDSAKPVPAKPQPAPPTPAAASVPPSAPPRAAAQKPPAPRAPARAPAKMFNARMKGQAYIPDRIEIAAGTTVQWKNLDALIHTVTAVDKSFNSGIIGADGTYRHTFTKPGTYAIYCQAHPFMKATVVVK